MRFVNPARTLSEQNLVACQNGQEVFFYTMRPVEPSQELLVWYSAEFSQRLCGHQQHDGHRHSEYRTNTLVEMGQRTDELASMEDGTPQPRVDGTQSQHTHVDGTPNPEAMI
jgi:hypothetical protein